MMASRKRISVAVLLWTMVAACGKSHENAAAGNSAGGTDGDSPGGTGGTGGSATGGAGGTVHSNTSTTGDVVPPGPGPDDCPPASSPGCCYGDGGCCSCVAKACDDWALGNDPGVPELTACVCRADVCGAECESACAGRGIDQACLPCVAQAAGSVCSAEFEGCVENPAAWCTYAPPLLGVCIGWPDGSEPPFAGVEGTAGAAGAGAAPEACDSTVCSLSLNGEVIAMGTGAPPACEAVMMEADEEQQTEPAWFQMETDQGVISVSFTTPSGGPRVEVGMDVTLSYASAADAESLNIETGGELLGHATRGRVLLPPNDLELSRGVTLCDEQSTTFSCREVEYRLDASLGSTSVSLRPAETHPIGPFEVTLQRYSELAWSEPGAECDPDGLTAAVIRTGD